MSGKLFVALDLGTSSCRALAFNQSGEVLARKSLILAPKRPQNGLSFYDGNELLRAQKNVLNSLLTQVGAQNVRSISVSCQRSTVVLWHRQTGEPLAPVLTWEDGRAAAEAENAPVSQAEVHTITGLYKTPYFSAPKIAWCLKNCPLVKQAVGENNLLIGPVASYFIWHLTGGKTFAADPTLAQRMLLWDIRTQTWSADLCKAFGIEPETLPEIRPSAADYGMYEFEEVKIPLCVCVGDQQAAAWNRLKDGQTLINYGTGAFLLHNAGRKNICLPGLLTSLSASCKTPKSDYLLEAPVNAAGSAFQWLGAQGISFDGKKIDSLCALSQNPVWFLPALGGLGAPYWDFSLSPVVAGLSPLTQKADWVAGTVRGIAFLLADIVAYLRANKVPVSGPVAVSGGLTHLNYLMQFQAGLLQLPLVLRGESESTALGAAHLAADYLQESLQVSTNGESCSFLPNLSVEDAKNLHQKWQAFLAWCKAQPK